MSERLEGCQSTNHEKCNMSDGLYECQKCKRMMCQEDGAADGKYRDYCGDCWLEATNDGEEEDVWVVRVYRERGKFYGESA